jgi:hypothetical protein
MSPLEATQAWFEKAVIGLNLCPFAKAVQARGQIRWVVSAAATADDLLQDLVDELRTLATAEPEQIDTTVLVHPQVLQDFGVFNDFLEIADAALAHLQLEGTIQIASFHPQYRFAGTPARDMANYTNRAPHPTLHLLRETSVARAVAAIPDAADIYQRNIDTLRKLGLAGWKRLLAAPESTG